MNFGTNDRVGTNQANINIDFVLQQSRKLAAISNSKAISGAIGNSGISVELLV
jgi:hypothetical protein